jgi:hypothetical protein
MPVVVWIIGSIWAMAIVAASALIVVGSVEMLLSLFTHRGF